jgi:hypothetical protein
VNLKNNEKNEENCVMRISKVRVVTLKLLGLISWVVKSVQHGKLSPKNLKGELYLGKVGVDIVMLLKYILKVIWEYGLTFFALMQNLAKTVTLT